MKKIILGFIILVGTGIGTNAQTLTGTQSSDSIFLTADNCYKLQGCYVVPSGKVLSIEKGTVIRCESGSNLVVERGGVIDAPGTAMAPIVFTSDQAIGSRDTADWGGISIFGNAENNESLNAKRKVCVNRYFGGTSATDNSGTLTYVRIEYAGDATGREEPAGLLLASVGNKMVLDHIQITKSGQNGLSILGGGPIVNTAYILDCHLNGIYANLGTKAIINGTLVVTQDLDAHHSLGTNAMLIENNRISTTASPLTNIKVNNCSFIGPKHCSSVSLSSDFKSGITFDYNGGGAIYNSVITGFKEYALYIEDAASAARTANDELNFSYNSMTNNGSGDYSYNSIAINPWNGIGCGFSMNDWISGSSTCSETYNQLSSFLLSYDGSFCSDYCDKDFVLNFVLKEDSELDLPGSSSILDNRGAVQYDALFNGVVVCPQKQVYCIPEMEKGSNEKQTDLIIIPNPANSETSLLFHAKALGHAKVLILDKVTGRVVVQKNFSIQQIGDQKISISVKGISEGVYPIQIQLQDAVLNGMISIR